MENKENIREAIVLGLLVEISLRNRYRRFKKRRANKKLRRDIHRHLSTRRRRRHRLLPGWKNIAVDGWDGMVI